MPTFRHAPWLIALLLGLTLSGCQEARKSNAAPKPVYVSTIQEPDQARGRTFTGAVRSRHETERSFRIAGKILAREVEVGERVVKGQSLARLDPLDPTLAKRAAEEQWRAAQVDAQQAARDEARFRKLLRENTVSEADHERQKARADAAAARLAQARSQLDLAGNALGYARLVADSDGVVTALRFEVGQVVAAGQSLITLADPTRLEIVVDLPESLVNRLEGMDGAVQIADDPKTSLPVTLRELAPMAAFPSRTFRARYALPEEALQSGTLRLGMRARLFLAGPDPRFGIHLPAAALIQDHGAPFVWLVEGSPPKLIARPVRVMGYVADRVAVEGVKPGERVVTIGAQKLDAGMAIQPIERPLPVSTTPGDGKRS
ncbi:MAG: efflux RND transporter periplasmic adaptor subunit [Magnetococcales bacterium]|nr:efflux RND transporter periplasmic adaptor subunit [Magnetococcales bacterium]